MPFHFRVARRQQLDKMGERARKFRVRFRRLHVESLEERTLLAVVPFSDLNQIASLAEGARSVFSADLDGDGDPDILSASEDDNKIAWYENRLNQPTMGFAAQRVITSVADGAYSVSAADLDGDGDQDVLSASKDDDTIAWYENRLDESWGDFGPQQVITASADGARAVFAVDLDGDGDADVLSASYDDDTIAWYENRLDEAAADFGPQQPISTNADGATAIHAEDLDGDGDADLLAAAYLDNSAAWYENRLDEPEGDFLFRPFGGYNGNFNNAHSVYAADRDGDGDPEAIFAGGGIRWFDNRLNESEYEDFVLEPFVAAVSHYNATSIVAVDIDGDGDEDVVSAGKPNFYSVGQVAWHEKPDPFWTEQDWPLHVLTASTHGALSVYAADLDGDGDPDIVSTSWEDAKLAWYENRLDEITGDIGPEQIVGYGGASSFAKDLDGDGDLDLISSGDFWFENRLDEESRDFGPPQLLSDPHAGRSVFAVDLDGDGDQDILSASYDNGIAWYENRLNEAEAVFAPGQVISTDVDFAASVFAVDLDGDGDADVLSASALDHKVAWYENRLDEATADIGPQQVITNDASGTSSVFAIDLDGDGDADVIADAGFGDKVAWYENRLNASEADFGPEQVITTMADEGRSVFAADLDSDGDADVLSASSIDSKIAWYENRLDEASNDFGPQHVITTSGYGAWSVFAADLDGDGDPDVLSASAYDNKIAWHENLDRPLALPHVMSVQVSGPGWVHPVAIPGGTPQLDPLPLSTVDQIQLVFSEHITVEQSDMQLFGINVPQYGFADAESGGFDYDPQTLTATWKLNAPISSDKLRIVLSDAVTDLSGTALDGDWNDGVSSFPSGDLAAGGPFDFRFNVLAGDINQSGKVDGLDLNIVSAGFWRTTALPQRGDASGDRVVDGTDVDILVANFGGMLPDGEPGSGAGAAHSSGTGSSHSSATTAGGAAQFGGPLAPALDGPEQVTGSDELSTIPGAPIEPAVRLDFAQDVNRTAARPAALDPPGAPAERDGNGSVGWLYRAASSAQRQSGDGTVRDALFAQVNELLGRALTATETFDSHAGLKNGYPPKIASNAENRATDRAGGQLKRQEAQQVTADFVYEETWTADLDWRNLLRFSA